MRILHIITRLILGGAQQNTVACCAAQAAAGHEVWLAYGPIYGPEGSLLEEAKKSGATLVEVRSMRRAVLPVHDVLCLRALRRLIRQVKPDVVHTHSSKAGIVGRAAAWREGVPAVIHTIHGLPFHGRQSASVRGLYVWLERAAARRCHKLIGITRGMCDAFRAQGIGRPEQFTVVPSGVDLAACTPAPDARRRIRDELGISADAPVVGVVARLDKLKGHDDLLDTLPALVRQFPALRVIFVGDGYHRDALERRIAAERLGERVTFTGLVPPPRVVELLAAMDVCALPSYQEGQSRVLVQALLGGCGIVGYDSGGIGEVCIDGQTGRLVPAGDRAALGDALAWMLGHPAERRRLVEQGRRHVAEVFDARVMVAKLEEIYREVLNRKQ